VLVLSETVLVLVIDTVGQALHNTSSTTIGLIYPLPIEYVAKAFDGSRSLEGLHRHARGSALESGCDFQDVLVVSSGLSLQTDHELKSILVRIFAMLTKICTIRPASTSTSTTNSRIKTMHRSGL